MGADGASARLSELARHHHLRPRQRAQLAAVLDALASDPQAPTSVCAPERAVDVHIADSLAALDIEAVLGSRQIADLGAGAGFPGVPLAVALPSVSVSLVESHRRKCEFLRRLSAAADVENVRVVCARVEEWREGLAANDVALARALAPQPVVLEYAAPLLRKGGMLVDWRGRRRPQEERVARVAARELGLERIEVVATVPFHGTKARYLHLYMKVSITPGRFPRRPGAARKRPLGGSIQA